MAEVEPDAVDADRDGELHARIAHARPEVDAVAREVMRANAARALFGASEAVRIGRYQLVREVGTGGGGSVFVARDPELDRDIALKLITATSAELRSRALSEGQALARLSHPNVVPVFDVGVAGERVYLVMELVRGESLRAYAERASLRDVVRAYRQAGDGLEAAHAAGLVHRDFKPDNAVIGADGRVRVIDFGLAVEAPRAGETTAVGVARGGTPAYMAPEQQRGEAPTPAADQYAFAVSLREAALRVAGDALPRWLDVIVRRGAAEQPAARYPSMAALLRALADDPRTRWRRRALITAPVVLAIAGFAIGRRGEVEPPPCDGAAALAPVWTPGRATAAHAHLAGLATPFAAVSAPRAREALAGYATRWIASHDAACVAARSEPSAMVIDRRAACLARARTQFDATLELVTRADADGLPAAMRTLTELPDLARCDDPAALLDDVPPVPAAQRDAAAVIAAEVARAQVRIEAATPDAIERADAAVARARELGYRPLLAVSLLAQGRARIALDQRDRAYAPLAEAYTHAFAVGDHATAVEAFARAAWVKGRSATEAGGALAGLDVVTAIAERLGPRDRFAHALLHNSAGVTLNAAGHPGQARARLTAALALARDVSGPGAVELASVRTSLALVTTDAAERDRLLAEAVATVTERLGGDHPLVLEARMHAAFGIEDEARARAALRPPCARFAELHPTHRATIVECASELLWLDLAAGATADARASAALVLAAAGDGVDAERVAIARAFAALLAGDHRAAAAELAAVATRVRPRADAAPWELLFAAEVELARALVARAASDAATTRAAVAAARAYLERAARQHPLPTIARRLAWARRFTD